MSEVIEAYVRRHPELSERDAFEGFLQEERIRTWVGTDDSRRERLRKEFGRVWGAMHATGDVTSAGPVAGPRSGPSGPASVGGGRTVRVQAPTEVVDDRAVAYGTPVAPVARTQSIGAMGGGRRLQVLCPSCKRIEVWMNDDQTIACRHCARPYHDMLSLVRVTPVGPFEFLFGEGWKGAATGGAIVAGLIGLYYLLRWL